MVTDAAAEDIVLEQLRDISNQIKDYLMATGDVNDIMGHMITRLEAIVNPTPEFKIKAISVPPMSTLSEAMGSKARQMNSLIKEALIMITELASDLDKGYVKCPKCQGLGEIEEEIIQRDRESVDAYKNFYTCPSCNGNKVIPISSDLISNCLEAINGLKLLRADIND